MVWIIVLSAVAAPPAVPDVRPASDPPVRVPATPLTPAEAARREALARYGVGHLRRQDDRPVSAMAEFETAAQLAPADPEPLRPLVDLYVELGRDPAAIRTARKVLELDPDDADTGHRLGKLLYDGNDFVAATATLKQAAASPRPTDRPAGRFGILRDLARAAAAADDWPTAETALRDALSVAADHRPALLRSDAFDTPRALDRERADVHERLGTALTRQKKWSDAADAFATAAEQFSRADVPQAAARLGWNLAEVLAAKGEPAAAATALEPFLKLGPRSPEPYQKYADLLRKAGRPGDVVPTLARLSRNHPSVEAIRWVIFAEEGGRDPRAADRSFRVTAVKTDDPEPFFPVAVEYYRQAGRPAELLALIDEVYRIARADEPPADASAVKRAQALTKAVKDAPDLTGSLLDAIRESPRADHTADTWELVGWLARRDGRIADAERAFREATRAGAPGDAAGALLDLLANQRKWAELQGECRRLIAASRRSRPLLYDVYLAQALAQLGRGDDALKAIAELPDQVSADSRVWAELQRVRVLNVLGRHDEAVAECERIMADHPRPTDVVKVRYQLADSLAGKKEYVRAEAELRAVLDRDPDDVLALNNLGYNLADQGRQLAEAEAFVRRAIALDRAERRRLGDPEPESGVYLDSLGWVLFRRGQLTEAREVLERAVTRPDSGTDAVVWDHLGDVAFRTGDAARAREAWAKAESLYQNSRAGREDGRLEDIRRKLRISH